MRNASSCFQFSKKNAKVRKTHAFSLMQTQPLTARAQQQTQTDPKLTNFHPCSTKRYFFLLYNFKNCNMTSITQLKCIRQLLALSFPGHILVNMSGNFQRRISRRRTTSRVIPNRSKKSERKYPFHLILLPESSAERFNIFFGNFPVKFPYPLRPFRGFKFFFADWKAPHVIEVFVSYLPCRSNAWQTVEDLPRYSARTYKKGKLINKLSKLWQKSCSCSISERLLHIHAHYRQQISPG